MEQITNQATGEIRPVVIVTDNGGPFKSDRFARFIDPRPELTHIRTKIKSPGQNGVRERAFGTLKYQQLYREEITDGVWLAQHTEQFRIEFNTVPPHEALAWNRPIDIHLGLADPAIANFEVARTLPCS